jgi:HlyD family secretion protein
MLRDVTTGIQDNQYIQISSGLKLNEQVVILPYGVISKILKDSLNVSTTTKEKLLESKELND